MPRSQVSPEVKAAALADLLAGEQPAVVAERYNINRNTVKSWSLRVDAPAIAPNVATSASVPIIRPRVEAQQAAIGERILDLLAAKLQASAAIARAASNNPDWIAKQSGSELAAFGEWLDRTAFAIGDRLAGGAERDDEQGDPGV